MTAYTPRQYIELFHLLLLTQLGQKLDKRFYALKGGGNLRFYFKSIRYSEDIDLDLMEIPSHKLAGIVDAVLESKPFNLILQAHGIAIARWSKPKQTETTQRWKMLLKIDYLDISLPTKVEFSKRNMAGNVKFETIDPLVIKTYQLSPIMLNHYDSHAAYLQKVDALITRKETQARDLFDLNLLLNSGADPTISDQKLKGRLQEAIANALAVTFREFKSQVLSFLHPDHQPQYDSKNVWDDMVLKIVETLGEYKK